MQQLLSKFWVLAHLQAYFVLHNSKEKNVVQNLFLSPIYLHAYLVYTFIRYLRVVKLAIINKNVNEILLIKLLMYGSMLISRFFSFWLTLKNRAGPEQESDVNGRKQGVCLKYTCFASYENKNNAQL